MESNGPPVRIVFWTRWFNGFMFDGNDLEIGRDCPIPSEYKDVPELATRESPWCVISPSRENVQSATAVVFHAADYFPNEVPGRVENQPWILETQESPLTALFRMDAEKMKVFDYLASYHLKSNFLFSYYSPAIMDIANRPLPGDFMASKTGSAPILWIARNCDASSGRQYYVEELMKYIKVDSYGSCLNNKKFPDGKSREQLMREYKFYLAIENANCDDYVTEKLYDTFLASAVPIVDGPASYDGFIPTKGSVIRMDSYPDPRDLARYIDYLDNNDTAYLEHLSFRRDALDVSARDRLEASFISNWSDPEFHNKRSSWCSVCRGMLPWWQARRSGAKSSPDPTPRDDRFIVDKTCMSPGKWDYAMDGPPYAPEWSPSTPDLQLLPTNDNIKTMSDTKLPDNWNIDLDNPPLIVWIIGTISGFAFLSFILLYVYRQNFHRNKLKKLTDALPL